MDVFNIPFKKIRLKEDLTVSKIFGNDKKGKKSFLKKQGDNTGGNIEFPDFLACTEFKNRNRLENGRLGPPDQMTFTRLS